MRRVKKVEVKVVKLPSGNVFAAIVFPEAGVFVGSSDPGMLNNLAKEINKAAGEVERGRRGSDIFIPGNGPKKAVLGKHNFMPDSNPRILDNLPPSLR